MSHLIAPRLRAKLAGASRRTLSDSAPNRQAIQAGPNALPLGQLERVAGWRDFVGRVVSVGLRWYRLAGYLADCPLAPGASLARPGPPRGSKGQAYSDSDSEPEGEVVSVCEESDYSSDRSAKGDIDTQAYSSWSLLVIHSVPPEYW